jgi:hypothetical protein
MHGDARPPLAKLTDYRDRLAGVQSPHLMLIAADVLVDHAMADPSSAAQSIERASDGLDEVVEEAEGLVEAGYSNEVTRNSSTYVRAALKRAELHTWSQAAMAQEVNMDYAQMLEAAGRAVELVYADGAWGYLVEYMPLLLMARGKSLGNISGMTGRLALTREDTRRFAQAGKKPGWDCGVAFSADYENHDHPSHRLQIKKNEKRSVGLYAAAGIKTLSAKKLGFDNAAQIVDSCLRERGERANGDNPLLSSAKLDEITANTLHEIEL